VESSQKNILSQVFSILTTIYHLIDKAEDTPGIYFMDLAASLQISRAGPAN
jgi:hypothetical protein